jgi:hypothetical protein
VDHIVWRGSKQFGDDGKLVNVIFSRKERLSLQHFRKYTPGTPDINFDIILLPREHNFWSSVIPGRDVARHLRILDTGKPKVTDFQVAILIHKDVARL